LLPKEGRILDIGCGYGFMAYTLGYMSDKRTIKGIDFDGEKTNIAQLGYLKGDNTSFEQADALEFNFETYDAVVMLDMLHYLQPNLQVDLLEKAVNSLSESGILVVRDGIKELAQRHKGTKLTEVFSTQIFGFNKTSSEGLSFLSSKIIYDLAAKFNLSVTMVDNAKFTSNVIFVLRKQI
jgi:2-polyprenyl-3-methyl-5-hydroxy-6-metoxy-1,4-benzoquinol methylase